MPLLLVATYYDIKFVGAYNSWEPSTVTWLLGMFFIPIFAIPYYLYLRDKTVGVWTTEPPDVKNSETEEAAPTETRVYQPETVSPDVPKQSDEQDSPLHRIPGIDSENTTRRNVLIGSGYVFGGFVILGAIAPEPEDAPPEEEFTTVIKEETEGTVHEITIEDSVVYMSFESGADDTIGIFDEIDAIAVEYAEFIDRGWDVIRLEFEYIAHGGSTGTFRVETSLAEQYNDGEISFYEYIDRVWETLET